MDSSRFVDGGKKGRKSPTSLGMCLSRSRLFLTKKGKSRKSLGQGNGKQPSLGQGNGKPPSNKGGRKSLVPASQAADDILDKCCTMLMSMVRVRHDHRECIQQDQVWRQEAEFMKLCMAFDDECGDICDVEDDIGGEDPGLFFPHDDSWTEEDLI